MITETILSCQTFYNISLKDKISDMFNNKRETAFLWIQHFETVTGKIWQRYISYKSRLTPSTREMIY